MKKLLAIASLFVSCLAISSAGCQRPEIEGLVPASGKVIYQGKPVEGATVSFLSKGTGRPATAITKSDGSFELMTLSYKGALPGAYSVTVVKTEVPPDNSGPDPGFSADGQDLSMQQAALNAGKKTPKLKELLPVKYANPANTPLSFEVKSSGNQFEIKLE